MSQLVEAMKKLLADMFAFRIKAQNYHWNVTGPNFSEYHAFFDKIYSDANEAVDPIAEHIRALDSFVPGSFSRFADLTTIEDEINIPNALEMIARLAKDNQTLRGSMLVVHDLAENERQFGLINFIEGLMDYNEKTQWMLNSFLKK